MELLLNTPLEAACLYSLVRLRGKSDPSFTFAFFVSPSLFLIDSPQQRLVSSREFDHIPPK